MENAEIPIVLLPLRPRAGGAAVGAAGATGVTDGFALARRPDVLELA